MCVKYSKSYSTCIISEWLLTIFCSETQDACCAHVNHLTRVEATSTLLIKLFKDAMNVKNTVIIVWGLLTMIDIALLLYDNTSTNLFYTDVVVLIKPDKSCGKFELVLY